MNTVSSNHRGDDKDLLLKVYDTGDHLDAKWGVMGRCRVSDLPFEDWVIRELPLKCGLSVLDVGAGSGRFSLPLGRALKAIGGTVVAMDISEGVMTGLRAAVAAEDLPVRLEVADVETVDLETGGFDIIIAGHMLYHLGHPESTFVSIRRALFPGGEFVATTNARIGMPEMFDIYLRTMERLGLQVNEKPIDYFEFTTETGQAFLERTFRVVRATHYDGGFTAHDGKTVLTYFAATQLYRAPMADETIPLEIRSRIAPTYAQIAQNEVNRVGGRLLISKPMTAFFCRA
jgi:SAM-dependent methyltransferase